MCFPYRIGEKSTSLSLDFANVYKLNDLAYDMVGGAGSRVEL